MEVVFSQQAELDLEEIADTIAIDSAPAAIRLSKPSESTALESA